MACSAMRAVSTAGLVVSGLICVSSATRHFVEPLDTDTSFGGGAAGGGPPGVIFAPDASSSRTARQASFRKLFTVLPLLASASPLVGESIPGLEGDRDAWSRPLAAKASATALPLRTDNEVPLAPVGAGDGPSAHGARQGLALPAAAELRGGSAKSQVDPEPEFSKPAATNAEREYPEELATEETVREATEILLQGAWRATFAVGPTEQLWDFEFVRRRKQLYAEISFYDSGRSEDKVGSDLVKLSPVLVLGRFLGFFGDYNMVHFQIKPVGSDLRVGIQYPVDKGASASYVTFAAPGPTQPAKSPSRWQDWPMPFDFRHKASHAQHVRELRGAFWRNLASLLWWFDGQAHPTDEAEIFSLLRKPGHWTGADPTGDEGPPFEWDFTFQVKDFSLVSEVLTHNGLGHYTTRFVHLLPYIDDHGNIGVAGQSRGVEGNPEYFFMLESGRLRVEVAYHMNWDVTVEFPTFLEHWPGKA